MHRASIVGALCLSTATVLGGLDMDDDALGAAAPTTAAAPNEARADTVRLVTPTGTLEGTLQVPDAPAPVPVVLLIAGSGPTDRDGNSAGFPGPNNSLRLLAEGLAARGIASLRYDKRGIAASRAAGGSEAALRFGMLVDDAAAWVRQLRADPRFTSITIVGHSEGSLVGMLAAERGGADAFVSIAGVARPAHELIHDQLAQQLPPPLMAEAERILGALAAGQTVDSTPPVLATLFRPSVQPYLISWFQVDPALEIAALRVPVLVAQGTTDIQVAPAEARRLAEAHPGARLLVIDGMNHVLKMVPADRATQLRSYSDASLPVARELVDGIASFVQGVPRR